MGTQQTRLETTSNQSIESRASFDFFCSYQHSNKDAVMRVCDLLLAKGFHVWVDRDQLYNRIGDNLHEKLAEGILKSDFFLCFVSKAYSESFNCKLEYKFALLKCKRAIFIILEKFDIPPGLEIFIANSLRLDVYKESNGLKNPIVLNRIIDSITRLKSES